MFRGAVVTQECVDRLIKKDMMDPVTGDKLSDRDIIPLQRVCVNFYVELGVGQSPFSRVLKSEFFKKSQSCRLDLIISGVRRLRGLSAGGLKAQSH